MLLEILLALSGQSRDSHEWTLDYLVCTYKSTSQNQLYEFDQIDTNDGGPSYYMHLDA